MVVLLLNGYVFQGNCEGFPNGSSSSSLIFQYPRDESMTKHNVIVSVATPDVYWRRYMSFSLSLASLLAMLFSNNLIKFQYSRGSPLNTVNSFFGNANPCFMVNANLSIIPPGEVGLITLGCAKGKATDQLVNSCALGFSHNWAFRAHRLTQGSECSCSGTFAVPT